MKLLLSFSDESRRMMNEIHDAIDKGNASSAERLSHSIKGVAANLGITKVEHSVGLLNGSLKSQSYDKNVVDRQLRDAEEYLAEALDSIDMQKRNQVEKGDVVAHEHDQVNIEKLVPLMLTFKSALEQNDTEAMEHFAKIRIELERTAFRAKLKDIELSLDAFNFDRALGLLSGLELDLSKIETD